jgi:hypothetical protein
VGTGKKSHAGPVGNPLAIISVVVLIIVFVVCACFFFCVSVVQVPPIIPPDPNG